MYMYTFLPSCLDLVQNIRHHCDEFGLDCEWIFFVTSHGNYKNTYDGIGGTLKGKTNATVW